MLIIPYTSEDEYRKNVDKILTLLSKNVTLNSIMLTEGEYSYIHNRHDVFEYAQKYGLNHRNHSTLRSMLCDRYKSNSHSPWCNIKYIVSIGTWAVDIIDNCFAEEHKDILIIHIQGPILPNQYALDNYENLSKYNVTVNFLNDNLISQYQIQ